MSGDAKVKQKKQARVFKAGPEADAPAARDVQFRAVFEHAPTGMLITDRYGIITEVNGAFCRFLACEASELLGRVYADWIDAEDQANEANLRSRMLSSKRPGYAHEARFRRKDGRTIWGKLRVTLLYNEAGEPCQMAIVCEDIHEQKHAEETLKQHDEEMAALYETSLAINAQLSLTGLLQSIIEHAARLLGARRGALYLVLADHSALELTAIYHMPEHLLGTRLGLGEGLAGRVAETGEPMMVSDHSQWEEKSPAFEGTPFQRVLGVPIKFGGKVTGVVMITDTERIGLYRPREVRLVSLMADQAGIAIENARLFHASNQRANQLDLLNRVGLAISSGLDVNQVAMTIQEQIQRFVKIDAFYLALFDELRGTISYPVFYEGGSFITVEPCDLHMNPGLTGYVIDKRSPVSLGDVMEAGLPERYLGTHTGGAPLHSFIGVPLIQGERILGVISIQNNQRGAFTGEDVHLMETIAAQAAVAVDNSRLFTEVQQRATVDELTKLYNYRGLMELGPREVERARRFNRPLSVMFYDIDNFRELNNRYSHMVGNQVLQAMGKVSLQTLRSVDLVTRFGGEEFVVLLPETPVGAAALAAERLRKVIQDNQIATNWGNLGVTVSIGVAELNAEMKGLAELIDRANQAEHLAKERGKNRVEIV